MSHADTSYPSQPIAGASVARNMLFTFTFIFFVLAFLLSFFIGVSVLSFISFCLAASSGFLMLVYAPAAIFLSVRDSGSRFDQAGGEVAYTVLQALVWLVASIFSLIDIGADLCDDSDSGSASRHRICRARQAGFFIIYLINLLMYIGWTAWIVVLVHRNQSMPRKETYKIPTHRLIRGLSTSSAYVEMMDGQA
ncbi:hypothetical protein I317_04255 [Kwoniella heveanensis CBS 569]|nr:hypothetical protein I317_04255 [Kwoniella heveanensis CBS 569]